MGNERRRWLSEVWARARGKAPERKDHFATSSGIELGPLDAPADPDTDYLRRLGFPGEFPFTRGIQPTMYRGRYWTMRQYAGFGSAEDANARYHYLLRSGQTGLSVAFDLPTQMGRDADHPRARGEVGKVGVSISSLQDMEALLKGIPLDEVSTSMTINSTAAILLSLYIAVGEKQDVPMERLSGTIQNDILKEYIARGTACTPEGVAADHHRRARLCALKAEVPISISGYHIREAGSTAAQEIAFTLGNGIAYVEAARRAGLEVDAFAGRLSVFLNVHNNVLEESVKFRAARLIWARIMKERFGAKDPRSQMLRAQPRPPARRSPQPDPARGAGELAWAAVRGRAVAAHQQGRGAGAPSRRSEARAPPSRSSPGVGAADIVDPLGGSATWAADRRAGGAHEAYLKIDAWRMVAAIGASYRAGDQDSAYGSGRWRAGSSGGGERVPGGGDTAGRTPAGQQDGGEDAGRPAEAAPLRA
jgi:methylmalonyl-CoA mutase N-terminal domain/subunit